MRKPSGVLAGIILTILSGLALATMDTGAKYLTGRLPVLEVVWARYFFHAVLMTAWLARTRGTTFLKTRRPLLQLARGGALLGATVTMYLGLSHVPLADATAVMFFAPVLVTVLSVVFLRETIGLPRIAAVLAGFGGVLLIVRPGFADTDPYLLLPLGAAVIVSVYYLLTRTLSGPEENAATLFHTTAAGAVILSLVVPFIWQTPSPAGFALMVGIGTLGALGHFCLVKGFAYAPASTLTPFLYFQVFFASIYSVVLIGDPLRPNLVVGAGILIASGLTIWWRENRRQR